MSQSEGIPTSTQFKWFLNPVSPLKRWFFSSPKPFPNDETGELMSRYMARKSWFDALCAKWCEQSLWIKSLYLLVSTLTAGVLGAFVGVPILFALTMMAVSVFIHTLLRSHENSRREHAWDMAADTIKLKQSLKTTQNHYQQTTDQLQQQDDKFKVHVRKIDQQTAVITEHNEGIQQNQAAIKTVVSDFKATTAELKRAESEVTAEERDLITQLQQITQVIAEALKPLETLPQKGEQFSQTVELTEQNQKQFFAAVHQFGLFVERLSSANTNPAMTKQPQSPFITALDKANNEWENLRKAQEAKTGEDILRGECSLLRAIV